MPTHNLSCWLRATGQDLGGCGSVMSLAFLAIGREIQVWAVGDQSLASLYCSGKGKKTWKGS